MTSPERCSSSFRCFALLAALAAAGCTKGVDSKTTANDRGDSKIAALPEPDAATDYDSPEQIEPHDARLSGTTSLQWQTDEKTALALARKERKPLLIEFSARWCTPCLELERRTFTDPAVSEKLSTMVLLRFDITNVTEADRAVQERYAGQTLPMVIALSPDGEELARIGTFLPPEPFLRALAGSE